MTDWISTKDRLPEISQPVLACARFENDGDRMLCYGCRKKTKWYLCNSEEGELIKGFDITHWMPLPEPPEDT